MTAPHSDIDPFADDVLADPYPYYRRLRDAGPAVHLDALDVWALPRYAEVRAALADWETFTSTQGMAFNDAMNQNVQGNPVALDPPEHNRLRGVLMERLSPREIRKFVEDIERQAETLCESLLQRGSFDGIADLAVAFPAIVVTDLIGLSADARDKLVEWGDQTFNAMGPMNERTQGAFPVVAELLGIMMGLTKDALRPGSAGEAIFEAVERGDITPEECVHLIWDYTGPGIDTTVTAIGTLIHQLALNPDQWDLLRKDPSLITATCNEALRFDPPIQIWSRVATRDWDADGVTVPSGARTAILLGSANRDERHYPDPDRFDVTRNPQDHLGFGFGPHSCVGSSLARAEMSAVLSAMIATFTTIEVGEPTRLLNNMVRRVATLPVTVS